MPCTFSRSRTAIRSRFSRVRRRRRRDPHTVLTRREMPLDVEVRPRVCLIMLQWTMRRYSKLPTATRIVAVETSMRFS